MRVDVAIDRPGSEAGVCQQLHRARDRATVDRQRRCTDHIGRLPHALNAVSCSPAETLMLPEADPVANPPSADAVASAVMSPLLCWSPKGPQTAML